MSFIGRLLISLIFIASGVNKIINFQTVMAGMAAKGLPMPDILLPAVIALELGGALALIFGLLVQPAALILAAFAVAAGVLYHNFWAVEPAQFMNQMNHFLKNIAIAGGLIYIAFHPADTRDRHDV